ncbi:MULTISPECIES: flagellar biosynthetic protein FliR [unclassified Roseivivax]|uniref:flagellar biosynthetic protein FliR n=1 Tax=Roseivivax sp. GX 12232 TaxID=2900547 RepID=UPI001E2DC78A|nr:flagellar biosynthetic protein FliR [Roseivivax sp. GX 12232]MCE0503869.1 flagellar biosynthetic protein FliR [Roseivivax sp. GX 12232]
MELSTFLTSQILGSFAVFARIGGIFLFMPGFGESAIPVRHRLALALVLSIALAPALPVGPLDIAAPGALLPVLALELTLGLWFGLTGRIVMSALDFAGYQIGMISGLANALSPNVGAFEGATLLASALMLAGTALIFAIDLHHVIIGAMVMSYEVFPLGRLMPGDMAEQMIGAAKASFYVGLSVVAPFYVLSVVLQVGLGLANRLMPTLPVFFVGMPVLLGAGLLVTAVAVPSLLSGVVGALADWLGMLRF